MVTFFENRSEVKQSGWFTTSQNLQDEITEEEKKTPVHRSTRVTVKRFTVTTRTIHQPTRLAPVPVTQPTQLATRTLQPKPQSVSYTTHEMKVYTKNEGEDELPQTVLPPTTTALVVKKHVR